MQLPMTLGSSQQLNKEITIKTIKDDKCDRPGGMKQGVSVFLTKCLYKEQYFHSLSKQQQGGAIWTSGKPHSRGLCS